MTLPAMASAHSTPSGASTPSRDNRFGSLAEFHHERISRLLKQDVDEVGLLAAAEDVVDAGEPTLDVEQLLAALRSIRAAPLRDECRRPASA